MAKATQQLILNFPPIIPLAMISYLEVEESDGDVLNELLGDVFGIELCAELELQRRLLLHILTQNLKSELNLVAEVALQDLTFRKPTFLLSLSQVW